jgi:hypothetical protein
VNPTSTMKKTTQGGNIVIGLIIGLVLGLGVALGIAVYVTKVPIPFVTKTQRGGPEQDEAEARKNRDWDPNAALAGKQAGAGRSSVATVTAPGADPSAAAANPSAAATPSTGPVPVVVAPTSTPSARSAPVPAVVGSGGGSAQSSDPLGDLARARSGGSPGARTVTASASPTAAAAGNDNSGGSGAGAAGAGGDDASFLYFVQAGAFRTTDDAEAQRAKLSLMGVEAKVTEREQAGRTVYRVRAGPFSKKDDADRLKDRLDGGGLESALVRVQR